MGQLLSWRLHSTGVRVPSIACIREQLGNKNHGILSPHASPRPPTLTHISQQYETFSTVGNVRRRKKKVAGKGRGGGGGGKCVHVLPFFRLPPLFLFPVMCRWSLSFLMYERMTAPGQARTGVLFYADRCFRYSSASDHSSRHSTRIVDTATQQHSNTATQHSEDPPQPADRHH